MADDVRTDARDRIAAALAEHRIVGVKCACGWPAYTYESYPQHLAGVVLGVFPDIAVERLLAGDQGNASQLVLRGPVEPVTAETWYAHPNDLIGGWAVMSVDRPPSTLAPEDEGREVAIFTCEEDARRISGLNNADLAGRLLPDGGETRTDWGVRCHGNDQSVGEGADSEWLAHREVAAGRGELIRQEHREWPDGSSWTGPWVEVTDA